MANIVNLLNRRSTVAGHMRSKIEAKLKMAESEKLERHRYTQEILISA